MKAALLILASCEASAQVSFTTFGSIPKSSAGEVITGIAGPAEDTLFVTSVRDTDVHTAGTSSLWRIGAGVGATFIDKYTSATLMKAGNTKPSTKHVAYDPKSQAAFVLGNFTVLRSDQSGGSSAGLSDFMTSIPDPNPEWDSDLYGSIGVDILQDGRVAVLNAHNAWNHDAPIVTAEQCDVPPCAITRHGATGSFVDDLNTWAVNHATGDVFIAGSHIVAKFDAFNGAFRSTGAYLKNNDTHAYDQESSAAVAQTTGDLYMLVIGVGSQGETGPLILRVPPPLPGASVSAAEVWAEPGSSVHGAQVITARTVLHWVPSTAAECPSPLDPATSRECPGSLILSGLNNELWKTSLVGPAPAPPAPPDPSAPCAQACYAGSPCKDLASCCQDTVAGVCYDAQPATAGSLPALQREGLAFDCPASITGGFEGECFCSPQTAICHI